MQKNIEANLRVRPHHALCMQFFRGEGYNAGFIKNTQELLEVLNRNSLHRRGKGFCH